MNVAAVIRAGRRPSMAPPYTLGIPRPAEAVVVCYPDDTISVSSSIRLHYRRIRPGLD
jgi:hypothetical protein